MMYRLQTRPSAALLQAVYRDNGFCYNYSYYYYYALQQQRWKKWLPFHFMSNKQKRQRYEYLKVFNAKSNKALLLQQQHQQEKQQEQEEDEEKERRVTGSSGRRNQIGASSSEQQQQSKKKSAIPKTETPPYTDLFSLSSRPPLPPGEAVRLLFCLFPPRLEYQKHLDEEDEEKEGEEEKEDDDYEAEESGERTAASSSRDATSLPSATELATADTEEAATVGDFSPADTDGLQTPHADMQRPSMALRQRHSSRGSSTQSVNAADTLEQSTAKASVANEGLSRFPSLSTADDAAIEQTAGGVGGGGAGGEGGGGEGGVGGFLITLHFQVRFDASRESVRGACSLPHSLPLRRTVLVFCSEAEAPYALQAGADYAGLHHLVARVSAGWTAFDKCIASVDVLPQLIRLARVLGPKRLMPSTRAGTVCRDIVSAVRQFKSGNHVEFRAEDSGDLKLLIGHSDFHPSQLLDNIRAATNAVLRSRPASAKSEDGASSASSSSSPVGFGQMSRSTLKPAISELSKQGGDLQSESTPFIASAALQCKGIAPISLDLRKLTLSSAYTVVNY